MLPVHILDSLWWEERWLELEAQGDLDLPAYTGATLRGAIGAVIRPALCNRGGACGESCQAPAECAFYRIFEQSRAEGGAGANIPKPLILEPPGLEVLDSIACGARVTPPYELAAASPLPLVANRWRLALPDGGRMVLGIRLLGPASVAMDAMVDCIRAAGLEVKGGRFKVVGVEGGRASLLPAGDAADGPLRLGLLSPTIVNVDGATCFDPARLGAKLLEQAVVRAVKVYNAMFAGPGRQIPFVEPRFPGMVPTASRLFRYSLPRHSYRQGRSMNFDGAVGWLEWEGATAAARPWLRAAEVLHLGQKASFGLGRAAILDSD